MFRGGHCDGSELSASPKPVYLLRFGVPYDERQSFGGKGTGMLKPEDLIGTWEMVEYYLEKDGKRVYPLGTGCKGYLMYTPDGYVSAQQMATGRPAYASGDLHEGTAEEMAAAAHGEEMAAAAHGYMAYAGRYEIVSLDPETGDVTVRHSMNVSMNPTWLGQSQERNAHVEDGILTIHAPVNGAHLVWRKVTNKE